jgi:diguanylate cyclase (GGDEF)-like protein
LDVRAVSYALDRGPSVAARTEGEALSSQSAEPREIPIESDTLDLVGILSAVRETAYLWELESDAIQWESNATHVLGVPGPSQVATGRGFEFLIAPEHAGRRHSAIAGAQSDVSSVGTPYRLRYKFMPGGRRSDKVLWIEDHGRWWPGPDGRPLRARGVLRVNPDASGEAQAALYHSDHDELTGQLNRLRLTEALRTLTHRAERNRQTCAFLMVAITNLSMINDTFGFDTGDEVIAAVARTVKSRLRGGDTMGRYSSNKFDIVLNDCGPGAMRIAADRFIRAVRELSIVTSRCSVVANVSIGGVLIPDQAATVQDAISNALQALDAAKQKRFDCFIAYEPRPNQESVRRRNMAISDDVASALEDGRMRLALQPIVNIVSGETKHYECLLRMAMPDGQLASAGEFIKVAEQLGMARLIDRRTLELTVALLKRHPRLSLALNVSGLTPNDHEWLVALHKLTGGKKALTNRLTIEITETAAINDIDQTIAFVDALKELGCKVAIDDFGAGYTSFRNLKLLDVDMVKIDGAFIKNLASDGTDLVFIRALRDLAQTFGMETVAEWVQDAATVELLREAGITYMQGYFCGEPFAAENYADPVSEPAAQAQN